VLRARQLQAQAPIPIPAMDPAIQAAIQAAVQAAEVNFQNQLQQTQNDLLAAQQQLQALQAQQQPPAVVPLAPPPRIAVFAYSPATTGAAAALINYDTTNGAKIQKAAIEKLHVEHDLDKSNLHDFLEALRSRSIACGWYDTLMTITIDGIPLSYIDNYGTITREAVEDHALTYMFHNSRAAQDSHNLFTCLESSLTASARTALYAESDSYTMRRGDVVGAVQGGDDNEQRRDGLMFLYAIINRTTSMTTATLSVLIDQIFNLPGLMQENNNDIQAFNTQVRKLLNMYYANKRQAFDETVLLNSLAKAYLNCRDEEFVLYVKRKWSDHQDGTRTLTSTMIMELALKQYQTSNENGAWGVNSKQVKSIMNLTSQVTELKKWRNEKSGNGKSTSHEKKDDKQGKSDEKKSYVPSNDFRKQRFDSAPNWMKTEPRDGRTSKKVNDVEYHWCSHHKLWQKHKSEDCRLNPANKNNTSNGTNNTFRQRSTVRSEERAPLTVQPGTTRRVTFTPTSTIAAVHADDEDF
jgi:hypothetical protein